MTRDDVTQEAIARIVRAELALRFGGIADALHEGFAGTWRLYRNDEFRPSEEEAACRIASETLAAIVPVVEELLVEASRTATRRILDELPAIPLRDVTVDDVLAEIAAEAQRRRPRVAA